MGNGEVSPPSGCEHGGPGGWGSGTGRGSEGSGIACCHVEHAAIHEVQLGCREARVHF